jgi:hypothetical protein
MGTMMLISVAGRRGLGVVVLLAVARVVVRAHAAELKVSREALERTLMQQLFGGPQGRYYLKGSTQADMLRNALEGSTLATGDKLTLDRLKIHSMTLEGDGIVVDVDGDISVN